MTKFPKDTTLEEDHRYLVALLTDIRNELKRSGKILATDRTVFMAGKPDPEMPTVLESLDGYIAERT